MTQKTFFLLCCLTFFLNTKDSEAQVDLPPITVVGVALDPFTLSINWLGWSEMMSLFDQAASEAPGDFDGDLIPVENSQTPRTFGCGTTNANDRLTRANRLFVTQRVSLSARQLIKFLRKNPNHGTYTINWPNGSTGRYKISYNMSATAPLSGEISCTSPST